MPVRGGRRRELKSLGSTYLEMDPLLSAPIPAKFHFQASAPAESWALLSLNCLLQLLPHSYSPLPSPPFFLAPKSSVSVDALRALTASVLVLYPQVPALRQDGGERTSCLPSQHAPQCVGWVV